jgi:cysteine protease, calpain family|nr:C2 family cysteine protease [uncultured Actinomyces sp.]
MGWFSTYISDPPGNADQIAGIKDGLSAASEKANSAEKDLFSITYSISTWAGQARDNYDEANLRGRRRLYNFDEGLQSATSDVEKYYWEVKSLKSYVDGTLRPALQDLDSQFDATPMADRWSKFWELRKEALSIQDDYNTRHKKLKQSAQELSESLAGALNTGTYSGDSTSARKARDSLTRQQLTEDDISNIEKERKRLASGHYDLQSVHQGSIGNCFYLASLMAVMNSKEGQEKLAEGIRPHYDSNHNIDGYYVTIYEKPGLFSGPSHEVFVQDTYAAGVSTSDHKGVISLYERAYAQVYPESVNGGSSLDALAKITTKDAHKVNGEGSWLFGWGEGYDKSERQEIIHSANSGRPTVANTGESKNFQGNTAPVSVKLPDGTQQTIDIYAHHSYMVKHADQSGVTLVNPHGENTISNTSDSTPNGEFTISWEDFQKYYGHVAIGSVK